MNSLIATVHMDIGKSQLNPTLFVYANTDIQSLVFEFIREWDLPMIIFQQILDQILQKLENSTVLFDNEPQGNLQATKQGEKSRSAKSYINCSIQQQKTVIKSPKRIRQQDMYTPIQRLKPEFKETQPQLNCPISQQFKYKTQITHKDYPKNQYQTKTTLKLRSFNKKTEKKIQYNPPKLITFRKVIEKKIRDIFNRLKGQRFRTHRYLIPQMIECKLTNQAINLLNTFLQGLDEEDFYSLDENKFTQLVFENNLASKFYQKFRL